MSLFFGKIDIIKPIKLKNEKNIKLKLFNIKFLFSYNFL